MAWIHQTCTLTHLEINVIHLFIHKPPKNRLQALTNQKASTSVNPSTYKNVLITTENQKHNRVSLAVELDRAQTDFAAPTYRTPVGRRLHGYDDGRPQGPSIRG